MKTPRRNPLDKERFLEGNRQKWVAIGLLITLSVMVSNIVAHIDPAPYLQAVMLLIGAGVLGWSVDSAAKIYQCSSSSQTKNETTETTARVFAPKHYDDPTIS